MQAQVCEKLLTEFYETSPEAGRRKIDFAASFSPIGETLESAHACLHNQLRQQEGLRRPFDLEAAGCGLALE